MGFLADDENNAGNPTGRDQVSREVFVPLPTAAPVQLPKNWSVRAYTPANTVSGSNPDPVIGNANGWYDSLSASAGPGTDPSSVGHWIFPETNFFRQTPANQLGTKGWQRQTNMVRFRNGTGELDAGNRSLALVIDPIAAQEFRAAAPFSSYRLDQAADLAAFVRRLLEAKNLTVSEQANRIKVVGDTSIDSVLTRPVTELAVYNERSLLAGLSRGLQARGANRVTGTVYADPATSVGPSLDGSQFGGGETLLSVNTAIGQWIEGRLTESGGSTLIETDARIFTLQRYLGQAQELKE